jgi:two-component system, cell cycle response regulator DivK
MTLWADLWVKVTGMRVMVVEDFEDTREMLRVMLEMRGCDVVEAVDGREAVDYARNDGLNLILMDLNLPVMSGYEATREILSSPRTRHIPVVAVSAQCSDERRRQALDAGCLECLEKPIDIPTLDAVLHKYSAA